MRELHAGAIVCEPRHASWFTSRANRLLVAYRIGRVAADPASPEGAAEPGGWLGRGTAVYYRLHGSPRTYWSVYTTEQIERWVQSLLALPRSCQAWCIFDNTAGGGAIENALQMSERIGPIWGDAGRLTVR
jgi:uncharacterized protein YecE (DUF72 family)